MVQGLLVIAVTVVVTYLLLWRFQTRLIYFPRRYALPLDALPAPLVPLRYTTSAGTQTALYLPPRAPGLGGATARPERLWLVFGGNAMVAIEWLDWADGDPDHHAGYLLLDYPGYGYCEGAPNRVRINENAPAAFAVLAQRLGLTPAALAARTCLLGHSLGAAAALEFAVTHPPRGIVLSAPFSTLAAVAAHHYGAWLLPVLTERWDNTARLVELGAHRDARPALVIVHGVDDEIVPFALGRRLAESAPWTRFVAVPGAHHNDLYDRAPQVLRQAMAEVSR
jgi:pimeloyl-ACP methyl ester carboxylesterase